jgi:hypothetical protein
MVNRVDGANVTPADWTNVSFYTAKTTIEKTIEIMQSDISNLKTNVPTGTSPLSSIIRDGGYTSIFNSIGCIGDSWTEGASEYKDAGTTIYGTFPNYSWVKYLKAITGRDAKNFGKGGSTANSWVNTWADANNVFTQANICDAYVIFLGINDIYQAVPLGSSADIDLNNYNNNGTSYYGSYAKIIQKIKALQPKAKIFCMTVPKDGKAGSTIDNYNAAIRYMCTAFSECYLIDLYTYAITFDDAFKASYEYGSHPTAIGYQYLAWLITTYIDWTVRNNLTKFKDVQLT